MLRLPRLGLRTRLSIGMVASILLITLGVTTTAIYFVKRHMQAAIANEEFERISAIAEAVDQKFLSRRTLLKTFGDSVEAHRPASTALLQDFLVQHTALKDAFANVTVVGLNGDLVAGLNAGLRAGTINIKDREYFRQTVATKAGVISQPYRNRLNGMAQVAMTEPVLDARGEVLYVISGAINLSEQNFLGQLANVKFGKSGYMFITNTNGIVIDDPVKSRILQRADAEGSRNPATGLAMAGFEGTIEARDRTGIDGLYAFKRIRQTNWVLGCIYPRDEAFAEIEQIERYTWAGALLLTLLAGGLVFLVTRSQLAPLTRLHEHMQVSRALSSYVAMTEPPPEDEIGDLSRTFDSLMLERQIAQERLTASERFLRDVTDNLPAVVAYFDRDQRCLFGNKAGLSMRGRTRADIGTMTMKESLPDAIYEQLVPHVAKVLTGSPTRSEGTYDRNGKEGFYECHLVPDVRDGGRTVGYYVMTFDITRQKVAERERAAGEARIRTITDNLPALVSHVDASLRYTFVNAHVRALHGNDELVGRLLADVRGTEDFKMVEPYVRRVLAGEAVTFEKTGYSTPGTSQNWYQSHYIPDRDPQGVVQGFYAMTFDVTERKRAEIRSAESEQRLRGLTDNVPALLTELDRDERVIFCNGRYESWLGIPPASIMNRPIREAVGEAHYEMRKPLLARAFAGEVVSFEQTAKLLVGERTLQTTYLPQRNAQGDVVGLYVLANDVTDLKHKQMQLDTLAREDALTGLPNRRSFEERVREALARTRRSDIPIYLLFLDIDYFKSINDSLGHAAGDAVLKEFGRRLKECVRETDMAARYAGDEFVILLEASTGPRAAQLVAEKVLAAMRPAFVLSNRTLQVTTSIGIARSEEDDEDFESLMATADSALYAAKKDGRNRFMMAASRSGTQHDVTWPRQESLAR
ncbi:diguanylate cyclase (GGDEF)-like protein/PAS domain S-box-containing protein [Variovorax soli]|uniref:Diguanylate cyclase (GGDEF)-like protein/PAS domain S-box-containing protein n=2 Tax=Variovorax soli TaxID=376815 RepID=A0ABU1NDY8_9BURK|nr:diguanylate cyclase (GGDEF)-like protein/PAS domain S-box-containing protein [Variovorax soli]